jgi:hypothetical protein
MRRIGLAVFVAAGIFLEPLAAGAQQARQGARVPHVGIILSNHLAVPDKDVWSIQAFLEGLGGASRADPRREGLEARRPMMEPSESISDDRQR